MYIFQSNEGASKDEVNFPFNFKMPQKFQILRCFSCETFNVDIVKKANLKWQCKMCGENQSIKNVYGTSDTAKECREIAQQLNQRRGEKMDEIQPFDENQHQEDVLPHSMATANLKKSEDFVTNTTVASKYITFEIV